ncbi:MAG: designed protein CTPR3, partial [Candidatus Azambacteria bacterium GW2011_GWB1_46_27]
APESYRVINNLGMAYADKGERENAEITYKKAIILDPSNAVAYHNLGNTYRETGRKDAAMENWQIAIKLDPKFVFSWFCLPRLPLKRKI